MWRIWHHSDPFPHPTPIKVVQSGTMMFQQDMHCFCFRDFEIGPKFSETRIFPDTILYPFILLRGLQRDKYFNVLNHKNHCIIIIGKHGTVNSLPLGIFSIPTYLPLPNHLPTLVPPCIPPTYPCLPTYQSPSSMGARARRQIKVWLKLHKV